MRIQTSRKSGFTLVEIMIVVAIIGLLAAIAIPNFVKARTTAQKNACIANLKQIDGAVEQYALEQRMTTGGTIAIATLCGTDATSYIKGNIPACPSSGTAYGLQTIGTSPACPTAVADHVLP